MLNDVTLINQSFVVSRLLENIFQDLTLAEEDDCQFALFLTRILF